MAIDGQLRRWSPFLSLLPYIKPELELCAAPFPRPHLLFTPPLRTRRRPWNILSPSHCWLLELLAAGEVLSLPPFCLLLCAQRSSVPPCARSHYLSAGLIRAAFFSERRPSSKSAVIDPHRCCFSAVVSAPRASLCGEHCSLPVSLAP
jgi:hypothetical protein